LIGDKYRLLRSLGEGAMAWVWLARHIALGVPVALKIMKPESTGGPLHEARTTASLRHPAIVAVFDSGCTERGDPFFVMEHLAGDTLADVLHRDGPLLETAAAGLLMPVLDALQFCHERGIVHRDLKPGNIFLARLRGRTHAKLLDFGIAKPSNAPLACPELAGTPGYMAPEQAHGSTTVDHRADLWAFCAVLYECIAGRPAIEGNSCWSLLAASAEPAIAPLRERCGEVSSLWPILERGLRKQPEQRFPVAGELRDALAQWLLARRPSEPFERDQLSRSRPRRNLQWRELPRAS
jgi:serine/threonine-protein kinase